MSYTIATVSNNLGIREGVKIGHFTIVKYLGKRIYGSRNRPFVSVICDCGTEKEVCWEAVKRGSIISCGCKNKELSKIRFTTHGYSRCGGDKERIHNIWNCMIQRCTNPNIGYNYKYYGGKGVKVCERWRKFENFLLDMGQPPTNKHTIDRFPNKDGDYEPGNCRWALMEVQNRNTSRNRYVIFNGDKITFSEAARKLNMAFNTFSKHLLLGKINLEIVK